MPWCGGTETAIAVAPKLLAVVEREASHHVGAVGRLVGDVVEDIDSPAADRRRGVALAQFDAPEPPRAAGGPVPRQANGLLIDRVVVRAAEARPLADDRRGASRGADRLAGNRPNRRFRRRGDRNGIQPRHAGEQMGRRPGPDPKRDQRHPHSGHAAGDQNACQTAPHTHFLITAAGLKVNLRALAQWNSPPLPPGEGWGEGNPVEIPPFGSRRPYSFPSPRPSPEGRGGPFAHASHYIQHGGMALNSPHATIRTMPMVARRNASRGGD